MTTNVSALTFSEVYDQLQILEYIATNTREGLTDGDREFRRALQERESFLLATEDAARASDPIQVVIGMYSVCMDINADCDLQVRVYPVHKDGRPWDCPIDTLDVLQSDVTDAEQEGAA